MPWHTRLTAPLVLVAAVLACSEQSEMQLTEPPLAQIEGGPACKLSDLTKAAKTFFGTGTLGYNLAGQFTTQNKNTTAVLPIFFDLANQIAIKARTTLTEAQVTAGAEVHRQAVACAPVQDPDYIDNMVNVKAALRAGGAYEVRGRTGTDNDVVLSHTRNVNGASAIKPPTEGFAAWTRGPTVFYGFSQATTLGGEAAADPTAPAVFQWFTVRPVGVEYDPLLRGVVGICVKTEANLTTAQLRIQHEDADDATVLPLPSGLNACTGLTNSTSLSPFKSTLAWLEQHLAPTPLQATTVVLATTTSPTGSIKRFSPVEAVNPGGATLTFVPSIIPNTLISEGIGVKVHAEGSGGVPWEGLNIKLLAFDNNGSFTLSPSEAVTDENGDADFTGSILDKAGAYKLLAITQPSADNDGAAGFLPDSVTSQNRFLRTPN